MECSRSFLKTNCPQGSIIVSANFDGLVQVFRNLLENAFKYGASHADGTGRITIWHERKENGFVFAVKEDNGPGIPRDKRERIFERFYRIDKHRSRNKRILRTGPGNRKTYCRADGGLHLGGEFSG